MIIGLVLLVLVGGVLIARNRLLPAEETWRITIDRAQSVLDSNERQILLWSGGGDLIVLDRGTGEVAFRLPLGAPVQNAALLESGVMAHWKEPGAEEATLGVATGPDDWLWQEQVPDGRANVIGVDAASDRMVLARPGDDAVLQGLDAGTGEVAWSKSAKFHSGWLGPLDPRHAFFDQTQLGVQEADGHWSLLSTGDGSVTADLGAVEPLTWQDHVVGNLVADGFRPAVFLAGKWQLVDWQADTPEPECRWLQPAADVGWLDYFLGGQRHIRPVDLGTGVAGPTQKRGQSALSEDYPPARLGFQDMGMVNRLVDSTGRTVWSHTGRAKLYPGPDGAVAIRDTDTLTEVVAGSGSVRRLELVSATGEILAEATGKSSDTTVVHHLSGDRGAVFVIEDEIILLGR